MDEKAAPIREHLALLAEIGRPKDPLPWQQDALDAADAMEVDDAMSMCIEAWNTLHSSRPVGFGSAGFIPFPALDRWAERKGLDDECFALLVYVINQLERDRAQKLSAKAELDKKKGKRR